MTYKQDWCFCMQLHGCKPYLQGRQRKGANLLEDTMDVLKN